MYFINNDPYTIFKPYLKSQITDVRDKTSNKIMSVSFLPSETVEKIEREYYSPQSALVDMGGFVSSLLEIFKLFYGVLFPNFLFSTLIRATYRAKDKKKRY